MTQNLFEIAFILVLLAGCDHRRSTPDPTNDVGPVSEEAWIVGSICRVICDLSSGSKIGEFRVIRVPPESPPAYRVEIPDGERGAITATIVLTGTPWDPEAYADLSEKLSRRLNPIVMPPGDTMEALLPFTSRAFEVANARLTARLAASPGDIAAHEEAAILLAAFGLRENAGFLSNPLPAVSHATAYLAIARALRGRNLPQSSEAELARLLIGLLANNQSETAKRIARLGDRPDNPPALAAWLRAAALRNSNDWRRPPVGSGGTRLEKLEKTRAFAIAAGPDLALGYLQSIAPDDSPEWSRILLFSDYPAESGHLFTKGATSRELAEFAAHIGRPPPTITPELVILLAALDRTGETRAVIDESLWAAAAQRRLLRVVDQTWAFFAMKWKVPDVAAQFWTEAESQFGNLRLFPVIRLMKAESAADIQSGASRLMELFRERPWDVPDVAWARAGSPPFAKVLPGVRELQAAWFRPPIPTGTAYRFAERSRAVPSFPLSDEMALAAYYEIAPLDPDVIRALFLATSPARNADDYRQLAGSLLDYDARAKAAPESTPDK